MSGDEVRIVGLQSASAAQHNNSIGEVDEWIAAKQRYNVFTEEALRHFWAKPQQKPNAKPDGLLLKLANLQLVSLGATHRAGLEPAAGQLAYYLQHPEIDTYTWPILQRHGYELPVYFFQTYRKLRQILDDQDEASSEPFDPQRRLRALQAVVRASPTLELCGSLNDRVRRRFDDVQRAALSRSTDATADGDEDGAALHVTRKRRAASQPDTPTSFDAMLLQVAAPLRVIQVASPLAYLNAITEVLGGGGVLGMQPARYKGRTSEQPYLYFLIGVDERSAATPPQYNAFASELAGFAIHGDALLADVELDHSGNECWLECGGIASIEAFLAERQCGLIGFYLSKVRKPLLGNWALPRCDVWPKEVTPKAMLNEWMGSTGAVQAADGAEPWLELPAVLPDGNSARPKAVFTDECGKPQANTPWQADLRTNLRIPGNDEGYLLGEPCRSMKQAEHDVALQLMQLLIAEQPLTPPLQVLEVVELDGAAEPAEAGLPAGTSIRYEYRLTHDAEGVLLEEAKSAELVLGGGLLHPAIEAQLGEAGAHWHARRNESSLPQQGTLHLHVQYHQVFCRCVLEYSVAGVELAVEDSEYEMGVVGPREGPSHGVLRMRKVAALLQEVGVTSVADVGCGEAKLLQELLQGVWTGSESTRGEGGEGAGGGGAFSSERVPFERLIGIDVEEKALQRGKRKLSAAWVAAHTSRGMGAPPPSCTLLRASLAELTLSPRPEALTLIEVIEHLDDPWTESVSAMIGRLCPRVLIVSTPNVEYNLNMMVQCKKPTPCAKRHKVLAWDELEALKSSGKLCSGCATFASGFRPQSCATYPRRNRDHRFEWTRDEFQAWAHDLATEHQYAVRFDGVGGGPVDEEPTHKFHGCDTRARSRTMTPILAACSPPPSLPSQAWADDAIRHLCANGGRSATGGAARSVIRGHRVGFGRGRRCCGGR
jgi:hypothetical protein